MVVYAWGNEHPVSYTVTFVCVENLPRLLPRAYSVAGASAEPTLRFAFNVIDLPNLGSITQRKGLVTGKFDDMCSASTSHLPKVCSTSVFVTVCHVFNFGC